MVEQVHEEKTATQLDTLSAALDSGVKQRVNRQDRERLDRVLSYPEDSAGGLDEEDDMFAPALAGGVVLTTVADVVGIFAFVGLASYVLLAR
jgi:Mg/Co/Ni transporter MgtE